MLLKILKSFSFLLYHAFVIRQTDNNWVKFGLVKTSKNECKNEYVVLSKRFGSLCALIYIYLFLSSLYMGWDCKWYLKYSANFWVVFDSKLVWFYCCLLSSLVLLQNIVTPRVVSKFWTPDWVALTDDNQIDDWLDLLSTKPGQVVLLRKRFAYFSKNVFRVLALFLRLEPSVPTVLCGLLFYRFRDSLDLKLLSAALLAWLLFTANGFVCLSCIGVPFAYFVIFCYRIRTLLFLTRKDLKRCLSRRSRSPDLTKKRLDRNIQSQAKLCRLVVSCNRLVRHFTAVTLAVLLLTSITFIYVAQRANNLFEMFVFVLTGAVTIFLSATAFLVANVINAAIKDIVTVFYQTSSNRELRLSVSARWQILSTPEYLNSKRNRIGFSCLHWFRLSHFTFVKVTV